MNNTTPLLEQEALSRNIETPQTLEHQVIAKVENNLVGFVNRENVAIASKPAEIITTDLPVNEAMGDLANETGVTTSPPEYTQNQTQPFDIGDNFDRTPIIGGEIISPTAVLRGESSNKPATERGWLSAITHANSNAATEEIRHKNIQEIATAALKAGVSKEKLREHLQKLGIGTTEASKTEISQHANEAVSIGSKLRLNEAKPPLPENFLPPAGGNVFNDTDKPTLAGRITTSVYGELVERPGYNQKDVNASEIIAAGKAGNVEFAQNVSSLNEQRKLAGESVFGMELSRTAGTDGFHFNGDAATGSREHNYYFNKSTTHWKNPDEPQVRAYVTVPTGEARNLQSHFVDLTTQLYDNGIDFTAKAASPSGALKRTDNMVFYISESDRPKAEAIIRDFLTQSKLGQGHVAAAEPSDQDGLSWAPEATAEETKAYQEISGSTLPTSFNMLVATRAMPEYLSRLATAHEKRGNLQAAQTYRAEASRVSAILKNIPSKKT